MANFCGVPSITLPVDYVVSEGQPGKGEVAGPKTVGKVPVGLMATGEWASESNLLRFGLDVEELCVESLCRPPTWVDVVELATQETKASEALQV